ncbi:MAG: type II secretion system protein [Patescibacteria group bacterium]|mgnify:CR=1 FL=1
MKNYKTGITLVEILIVLGVIVILIAVLLPSFTTVRRNQVLKSTTSSILSALDKAKSSSISSIGSSEYGIHFESSQIVIFQGIVYSSSDVDNEVISISSPASISNITLTGGSVDLYFDRLSGVPNRSGTITISASPLSQTITISATGAISLN